ncbi:hypothetical protein RIF29_01929 [Crotalaria pallida]|uniref:Uncharacterized protein n=1 Tax=Crotalaria pallida TaxID=3830 RepID=A0AAN9P8R4_CROPI
MEEKDGESSQMRSCDSEFTAKTFIPTSIVRLQPGRTILSSRAPNQSSDLKFCDENFVKKTNESQSGLTDITNTINASRRRMKRVLQFDDELVRILSKYFEDITDDVGELRTDKYDANEYLGIRYCNKHVHGPKNHGISDADIALRNTHNDKENLYVSNAVVNNDIPESSSNRKRNCTLDSGNLNLCNNQNPNIPGPSNRRKRKRKVQAAHQNQPCTNRGRQLLVIGQTHEDGQAQQSPMSNNELFHFDLDEYTYDDCGDPNQLCQWCGAKFWIRERIAESSALNPIYTLCCSRGKIQLPLLTAPPLYLQSLMFDEKNVQGKHFKEKIRAYNSMFSFTSMGGKLDKSVNDGRGRFVYRLSGQNHHRIGSLLPAHDQSPKFAQLYIYDTHNEVENRINALSCSREDSSSDGVASRIFS